jgi:hypothetical protein
MFGRTKLEFLLGVLLLVTSGMLWVELNKVRSPLLPGATFSISAGKAFFLAQGTWRREDQDNAFAIQTTSLECDRATKKCHEATAIVTDVSVLPININTLEVIKWDDDFIVIRGPSSLCTEEIYTADIRAEFLAGVVTPKSGCQSSNQKPFRIRLVDGYQASKALRRGR